MKLRRILVTRNPFFFNFEKNLSMPVLGCLVDFFQTNQKHPYFEKM